jgi:hypothetical protein
MGPVWSFLVGGALMYRKTLLRHIGELHRKMRRIPAVSHFKQFDAYKILL